MADERDYPALDATKDLRRSDKDLMIVNRGATGGGTHGGPFVFIHGRYLNRAEASFHWDQGGRPTLTLKFLPQDVELIEWTELAARRDAQAKAYREAQDAALAEVAANVVALQPAHGLTAAEWREGEPPPADDECNCGACGIDHN